MRYFKVLCPDALISSILGHGGAGKKELEQETGTTVKISRRDDLYPGTRCRIMIVSAPETNQILHVLDLVTQNIVELSSRDEHAGKGGKHREDSEALTGREPGEFVLRAALPHAVTGAVIGPRGERIKSIRATTGAKVFVENDSFEGHQMVRVIGVPHSINQALPQILQIIDEEMSEDVMADWARIESFDPNVAPGPGKAGGKKGGGKGKGKEDRGQRPRSRSRSRGRGHRGSGDPVLPVEEFQAEEGAPEEEVALLFDGNMLEALNVANADFPDGRQELAHAINCDLPADRVSQLMGPRKAFSNFVSKATGCSIEVSKAASPGSLTISIQGPLFATYEAHALLMKQYHEQDIAAEEEQRVKEEEEAAKQAQARDPEPRSRSRGGGGGRGRGGGSIDETDPAQIENLQSQLAALQQQLKAVQRDKGGGNGGGKGGGKSSGKFGSKGGSKGSKR